eukprot:10010072-Alexandrium_andersonii.AAC.1
MTPTSPESAKAVGGVAIASKAGVTCQPVVPRSEQYREAFASGRALLCLATLGPRVPVMVASVYGWATQDTVADKH